jgi:hypothetical protein
VERAKCHTGLILEQCLALHMQTESNMLVVWQLAWAPSSHSGMFLPCTYHGMFQSCVQYCVTRSMHFVACGFLKCALAVSCPDTRGDFRRWLGGCYVCIVVQSMVCCHMVGLCTADSLYRCEMLCLCCVCCVMLCMQMIEHVECVVRVPCAFSHKGGT